MNEDEVPHRFDHRPLTVDAQMFAPFGQRAEEFGGLVPRSTKLPPPFSKFNWVIGPQEQPHWVSTVKFSLNVRHHLDAVYDEVRDEAVNHYVGHKRPNKSSPAQIALTKLCACEILVVELSHNQS